MYQPAETPIRTKQELNRIALIDLLRDSSRWPEGFHWNYSYCHTCAIGLLCRSGMVTAMPGHINSQIRDGELLVKSENSFLVGYLGLSFEDVRYIFWRAHLPSDKFAQCWVESVRPERVADLLEATLS